MALEAMKMGRTSDKQEKILMFLNDYMEEYGYAPSVREICAAVGLKSTATVSYHLNELKRQGRIEGDSSKRRAISLPESRKVGHIPLLGVVTAGPPILALENIEGFVPWDGDPDCYALRIKGDSMINAGIFDGDKIVVKKQETASNGDIVVALIDDSATVKRFYKQNGKIILHPENDLLEDIVVDSALILGVVVGLTRKF